MEEKKARKMGADRHEEELQRRDEQNFYDPFGKGGAGAPMRAPDGNVVANRDMLNNKASDRGGEGGGGATAGGRASSSGGGHQSPSPHGQSANSGASPASNGFGFADQKSREAEAQQKQQSYQDVLREQVETKARKKREANEAEEKEAADEAARIAKEQEVLKARFEDEQKKVRLKEERIKAENDARRKDAEAKRAFLVTQQEQLKADHQASKVPAPANLSPSGKPAPRQSPPSAPTRTESPPIPTQRKRMTGAEDDPFNTKNNQLWTDKGGAPLVVNDGQREAATDSGGSSSQIAASPQMEPFEATNATPHVARQPSPPIPTLANKQAAAAQSPPVPAMQQPTAMMLEQTGGVDPLERQLKMYEADDLGSTQRQLRGAPAPSVSTRPVEGDTAFLERREKTVELEDAPHADLHDSVHDSSPLRANISAASSPKATQSQTHTNDHPPPFDKADATSELMDQLSALRKRLEGEQQRVDSQLQKDTAHYSQLADQSRKRKEQQSRIGEADDVVGEVLTQLRQAQNSDSGGYGLDAIGEEAATSGARAPVFVGDTLPTTPPPDESVLSTFNKMKYHAGSGTDGHSAQHALLNAFPEPPTSEGTLDTQQRALIQAQERELELLRGHLGGALDRHGTMASLASSGSFNLDLVSAKNEERLRRLNATSARQAPSNSKDILSNFLGDAPSRQLGIPEGRGSFGLTPTYNQPLSLVSKPHQANDGLPNDSLYRDGTSSTIRN
jgi:hypothetical protein